ncbi:uncharacterized protein DSM5745_05073 [Aspergillus mulundensis]|uniref:Glycosyltransferase 2-like domain-containing protein n=1 Tax=Aspergillus mulundensis TaxID=1810919 RepID=A0A3D8S5I8_9EURO|nr:hypothetical protein DSM5745_05073 [Aspergillus mulundensis]RDW81516.1 hypothetical protein DSM5745_05073 [Aspergillus mulundensis]
MLDAGPWMWALFFIEFASYGQMLPFQILRVSALKAEKNSEQLPSYRRKCRLVGGQVPLVDVYIPCCGEPLEIIVGTVRGACLIDFPQHRFAVHVLDDGNSLDLRKTVEELRIQWPNLHYHYRGLHDSGFDKAGNLNHLLLNEPRSTPVPEFITVLDADFIPAPDLLRAGLAHLVTDPTLAIVGTLQMYYNLPPGDPLYQGLEWYSAVLTPQLNALGAAVASGSGCIIRRDPLVALGGFPTLTSGEDMILSYALGASGHRIIQLTEPLQYGRVPESMQGHMFQRKRWSVSLAQRIRAWKDAPRNPIPASRRTSVMLEGVVHILTLFFRTVEFVVLPLLLLTGQPLIPAPHLGMLKVQLAMATLYLLLLYATEYVQAFRADFRVSIFPHLEEAWMAPGQLLAIIQKCFSQSNSSQSQVTGSTSHAWNRDIPDRRASSEIAINAISLLATLAGAISHIPTILGQSYSSSDGKGVVTLLSTIAYPPMLHLVYTCSTTHWIPLRAYLYPPRYPALLTALGPHPRDPGALFPTKAVRERLVSARRPALGHRRHFLAIGGLFGCVCAVIFAFTP